MKEIFMIMIFDVWRSLYTQRTTRLREDFFHQNWESIPVKIKSSFDRPAVFYLFYLHRLCSIFHFKSKSDSSRDDLTCFLLQKRTIYNIVGFK